MKNFMKALILHGMENFGGRYKTVAITPPRNRKTVTAAQQKRAARKRSNIRKRSR